jgi:hypothetical protein
MIRSAITLVGISSEVSSWHFALAQVFHYSKTTPTISLKICPLLVYTTNCSWLHLRASPKRVT